MLKSVQSLIVAPGGNALALLYIKTWCLHENADWLNHSMQQLLVLLPESDWFVDLQADVTA